MNLPSGTITFLFTDIEGSTWLWEQYPEAMRLALARHDALMRQVIEQQDGHIFKTMGADLLSGRAGRRHGRVANGSCVTAFLVGAGILGRRSPLPLLISVAPFLSRPTVGGDRLKTCADALNGAGSLARSQSDFEEAHARYEESLAIRRELGEKQGIAGSLGNLANLAVLQEDTEAAHTLYQGCLEIFQALGDNHGIVQVLDAHASLDIQEQQPQCAVRLWAASTSLRDRSGIPRFPAQQERYDTQLALARAALGETAFATAFQEGYCMTPEQILERTPSRL